MDSLDKKDYSSLSLMHTDEKILIKCGNQVWCPKLNSPYLGFHFCHLEKLIRGAGGQGQALEKL